MTPIPRYIELAAHEKGFAEYFAREIAPQLETLEEMRKSGKLLTKKRGLLLIPISIAVVAMLIWWGRRGGNAGSLFIFYVAGALVWAFNPRNAYQEARKKLLPAAVNFFGTFRYSGTGLFTKETLKKTGLVAVPMGASVHVSNGLTGVHQGKRIDMAYVTVVVGSGKNRRTAFQGLVVLAALPKRTFKGMTVVRERNGEGAIVGVFFPEQNTAWHMGKDPETGKKLEHVDLESNEFEREFDVLTTDQTEARYALNPEIMHELLELAKTPGSKRIECSFVRNVLCFTIEGAAPLFIPPSDEKDDGEYREFRHLIERMHHTLTVVDRLDD